MFNRVGDQEKLVDRVVNEIQKQIVTGVLTPGMMLPPERELCEQLGVSRTALREAVRMLATKGLLEPRRGVGTVVRQVTSSQITESLSILISNHSPKEALDKIDQVRRILEVAIARLAAEAANDADIAILNQILAKMDADVEDRAGFNVLDNEFHNALAATTHNPILIILLNSIQGLLSEIRRMVENDPDLVTTVLRDHHRIAEQVAQHNPAGAAEAMTRHLEDARRIQDRYL
jgi:GntR family transcriptional regulator, transcriptional repressor for pyruvate dehydrogenase complex